MKKLTLSEKDKKLFGLCGGLGEYFGIDSTLIRLVWVLSTVFTALVPGVLAYLLCVMVVPSSDAKA